MSGPTITRREGNTILMDINALAQWTGRPIATIRLHCRPIARDHTTRRNLYDAFACQDTLDDVPQRQKLAH